MTTPETTLSTPRQRLLEAQILDSLVEPQVDNDEGSPQSSLSSDDDESVAKKKKPDNAINIQDGPPVISSNMFPEDFYNFHDDLDGCAEHLTSSMIQDVDNTLMNLKSWKERLDVDEAMLQNTLPPPNLGQKKEFSQIEGIEGGIETLIKDSLLTSQVCINRASEMMAQNSLRHVTPLEFPPSILSIPENRGVTRLQLLMKEVAATQSGNHSDISDEISNLNFGAELGECIDEYSNELEDLLKEIEDDLE